MRKLLLEACVLPARSPSRRRRRPGSAWRHSPAALDARRRAAGWAARLSIREVDAGSCNGCELEIHALNNAVYDLERFGLRFVASPRHADVLLVTGPVTANMREALVRTWRRDARSQMGGGGRRLRARWRPVRGFLRLCRRRFRRPCRSISTSAAARRSPTQLLRGLLALLQA